MLQYGRNYFKIGKNWKVENAQELKNSHRDKKRVNKIDSKSISYLSIGFYIVIPLLIGVFIGYNLDIRLKSKPFFVLFFIVFGLVSGFYNLLKVLKNN